MRDEIARWSAELARDPGGPAWIPLADAMRRAGRIDAARRVVTRGLGRHPYDADGHDTLVRISADAGDLQAARDEWETALQLEPRHTRALAGLGWLAFRNGDHPRAESLLQRAHALAPDDAGIASALQRVVGTRNAVPSSPGVRSAAPAQPARAVQPTSPVQPAQPAQPAQPVLRQHPAHPAPPAPSAHPRQPVVATAPSLEDKPPAATHHAARARDLFADLAEGNGAHVVLLDRDGLVVAGKVLDHAGADRSDELGAEFAGVCEETSRTLEQLRLGAWEGVMIEADDVTLALAPCQGDGVVLLTAPAELPPGLTRRLMARARGRAESWLEAL